MVFPRVGLHVWHFTLLLLTIQFVSFFIVQLVDLIVQSFSNSRSPIDGISEFVVKKRYHEMKRGNNGSNIKNINTKSTMLQNGKLVLRA